MNAKENILLLCTDILNSAEKKINARLDNEKNQGQTALGEEIAKELMCDQFFAIQIISAYIKERPDIHTTKGRNGGISRIKEEPKEEPKAEVKTEEPVKVEEQKTEEVQKLVAEPVKEVKVVLSNEGVSENQTAEAHRKVWKEREDKEARETLDNVLKNGG